jgi:receptor protein-tyrosine kinase
MEITADKGTSLQVRDQPVERASSGTHPIITPGDIDVLAARDPHNEAVESIRALRSQLMFSWLNRGDGNALAITSPGRAEGRSWLASNLAVLFAQMGKRVLLVDADLRRPLQHRAFGIENRFGLSALLTGRADALPVPTGQLNLYVLAAGTAPPNPQELLSSAAFGLVTDRFAKEYEVVLFDTPPSGESSDAQLIAGKAGAAVLLARRNQTRHDKLATAMWQMRVAAVNVVGCVLNDL